ncbi:hypothetical protein JYT74_01535 [Crocinitomix catalasitica]|nr:hypothetical protein [Crocinitomix catalasitica]
MKKVLGIATLISVISLVTMIYLTYDAQADVPALYIQISLFLLVASLALVGCYSVQAFCPNRNKMAKTGIFALGSLLLLLGALVCFNLIDFLSSINWLISLGIIFLMLVQLQLLGWGSKTGSIIKISSLLIILSNIFLAIFFITKMEYADLEIWIHGSILCSLIAFIIGLLFVSKSAVTT